MPIFAGVMQSGGNMPDELQARINRFLAPMDQVLREIATEMNIPFAQVGFIRPCRIAIFADSFNVYLLGSNVDAGGTHTVSYLVPDSGNARDINEVFNLVSRHGILENPFGIAFMRTYLGLEGDEARAAISVIVRNYMQGVVQAIERAARLVRINPIFIARELLIDDNLIFCLSPFRDPYNIVFTDHICGVVRGIDPTIRCIRADSIFDNRPIMEDIWTNINRARIVISDLSERNPNVFYETGIAHTVGKEVILITQSMDDVPFDLRHLRCIVYNYTPRGMHEFEAQLTATITNILARR